MRIMHNYSQNAIFLYHNLKLHKMIEMHSKYDNMHTNVIFNALNCINNHVNSCINCTISYVYLLANLLALLIECTTNLIHFTLKLPRPMFLPFNIRLIFVFAYSVHIYLHVHIAPKYLIMYLLFLF